MQRYRSLTKSDLAAVEAAGVQWVTKLQNLVGGSTFEIARLMEESIEKCTFPRIALHLQRSLDEESKPNAMVELGAPKSPSIYWNRS